jgi:L-ascorbate metabolism protein UlaG (beta-lactamase superfamily)
MRFFLTVAVCTVCALSGQAQSPHQVQTFKTSAGLVKITPIYHASTLVEAGGKVIYVDPARLLDFTGLPPADLILISDIHTDHMDPAVIAKLSKAETKIIAPPAVAQTVTTAETISNGQTAKWDKWSIEATPAYNIVRGPAPGKLFHDRGRGNGYVLTFGGKRFYFSGDTENIPELQALKNIDVAFICMSERTTMSPEEAVGAVLAFRPTVVIPYHYRTADLSIFQKKLEGRGIEVRILDWYPKEQAPPEQAPSASPQ